MGDHHALPVAVARSELLLGVDPAGKRAYARRLAQSWLDSGPDHRVVYVAQAGGDTLQPPPLWPPEDPASRQVTVEEPTELAHALGAYSRSDTLIVVDCLTLWLTAAMMRAMAPDASDAYMAAGHPAVPAPLSDAVRACAGPLVLVGDAPAGLAAADIPSIAHSDAGRLMQTLGDLQQQAAAACERVSLVTGGQVLTLKAAA